MGSDGLLAQLRAELEAQGRRPYVVPVGGSSSLGAWGYLQVRREGHVAPRACACRWLCDSCRKCGRVAHQAWQRSPVRPTLVIV